MTSYGSRTTGCDRIRTGRGRGTGPAPFPCPRLRIRGPVGRPRTRPPRTVAEEAPPRTSARQRITSGHVVDPQWPVVPAGMAGPNPGPRARRADPGGAPPGRDRSAAAGHRRGRSRRPHAAQTYLHGLRRRRVRLPGRVRRPARRAAGGLGRALAHRVGRAARLRGGRGGRGAGRGLRGRPGDLRGGGRTARRHLRRDRGRRHHRRRLGRGPRGAGRPRTVLRGLPGPPRPGPAQRPPGGVGPLDHPGVRTPPLRHLVLRGGAARGPAHPERLHGGRPYGVDPPRRGRRGLRPRRALDDAADDLDAARPGGVRDGRRSPRGGRRPGPDAGARAGGAEGRGDRPELAGARGVHQAPHPAAAPAPGSSAAGPSATGSPAATPPPSPPTTTGESTA
ncbi:hypothetical protein OEIGOIKO_03779 [Streptomyces chrestomyceticus JCM 4735]|uniref:Uncharacterized protein n=1 Tax=Streptomyces chrestomyceticus JCM 4735 TaxID=1306181 RepID=A0A7U9KV79_9ACTN|nr:hypothetical protein OEIGOIKO_03779 [Streptomyces chrestomyceticus JCM 4735]